MGQWEQPLKSKGKLCHSSFLSLTALAMHSSSPSPVHQIGEKKPKATKNNELSLNHMRNPKANFNLY